ETLSAMLKAFGFTDVRCATDGAAAWELLRRRPFGLVISDWNMAPMSGIELLRLIRADPGLGHVQFLMLTANARSASRIAAADAGVDGFLVKPFRPDALAGKIRDVLAVKPQLDWAG
uniref:response regulator n=1 Tax=uncultured Methylobacterium sp. TaxID=157278 RepID=UPI0035CA4541